MTRKLWRGIGYALLFSVPIYATLFVAWVVSAHDHRTIEPGEECHVVLTEPRGPRPDVFVEHKALRDITFLDLYHAGGLSSEHVCEDPVAAFLGGPLNLAACEWGEVADLKYERNRLLHNDYYSDALNKMNRCRNTLAVEDCTACHAAHQFRPDEVANDPAFARPASHPMPR
jgi:hypothetical protein